MIKTSQDQCLIISVDFNYYKRNFFVAIETITKKMKPSQKVIYDDLKPS